MAEKAGERVQKAIENVISELDKSKLRRMQREMHLCAAKCCDDSIKNIEGVHQCVERCGADVAHAQSIVQSELNNLQSKLQRCVMSCQDEIRDQMPATANETDANRYRDQFERCVVKCADTNIDSIPSMMRRIKELIDAQTSRK